MSDLFGQTESTEPAQPAVQQLFVDEAGDSTLFHSSGKPILDMPGCIWFFMLGKLEVDEPAALSAKLEKLRRELLADPYFSGVESRKPKRKRTALLFHAEDDLPKSMTRPGPAHGTFFNQKQPLTVKAQFPEQPVKKKKS